MRSLAQVRRDFQPRVLDDWASADPVSGCRAPAAPVDRAQQCRDAGLVPIEDLPAHAVPMAFRRNIPDNPQSDRNLRRVHAEMIANSSGARRDRRLLSFATTATYAAVPEQNAYIVKIFPAEARAQLGI